jgi:hypothetical protein
MKLTLIHEIFKNALAFFFLFFLHGFSIGNGQQGISYNGSVFMQVWASRLVSQALADS